MARQRQPMTFRCDRVPTPIGAMFVLVDDEGRVRGVDFEDFEERMLRLLRRQYGEGAVTLANGRAPQRAAIEAYFAGDLESLDGIEVVTGGTAFQREVWAGLRTISAGETLSYGGLAARIGRPSAMRAVGLANGSNPIGVIVPCHRVIGADGSLTGYGGGIERKRWLLRHEGARFRGSGRA